MADEFTRLVTERRDMDVELGSARRDLARVAGAVRELGNTHLGEDDEAVVLLSAEVDCQRRTLDALSRLDDEKQRVLERQQESIDHLLRQFSNSFGCSELAEALEELRQTEQRVRDLEDALLADAADAIAADEATAADRKRLDEEERYLRRAVQEGEHSVAVLDEGLKQLTQADAEYFAKLEHHGVHVAGHDEHTVLQTKRGALRSKIAQRSAVVNKLAAAADAIAPYQLGSPLHNNINDKMKQQQQHRQHRRTTSNTSDASSTTEDDPLASSMRSFGDVHRVLSLVKSAVCHLRDDFQEISSAISHYTLEKASFNLRDTTALQQLAQREMHELLFDISHLSASVLEERFEDDDDGVSVHQLLSKIRRFCVCYDLLEPALGQRALFEQMRLADDFGLLPQLYSITMAALDVREELRRIDSKAQQSQSLLVAWSNNSSVLMNAQQQQASPATARRR